MSLILTTLFIIYYLVYLYYTLMLLFWFKKEEFFKQNIKLNLFLINARPYFVEVDFLIKKLRYDRPDEFDRFFKFLQVNSWFPVLFSNDVEKLQYLKHDSTFFKETILFLRQVMLPNPLRLSAISQELENIKYRISKWEQFQGIHNQLNDAQQVYQYLSENGVYPLSKEIDNSPLIRKNSSSN